MPHSPCNPHGDAVASAMPQPYRHALAITETIESGMRSAADWRELAKDLRAAQNAGVTLEQIARECDEWADSRAECERDQREMARRP